MGGWSGKCQEDDLTTSPGKKGRSPAPDESRFALYLSGGPSTNLGFEDIGYGK